jgi:hypothetical protein
LLKEKSMDNYAIGSFGDTDLKNSAKFFPRLIERQQACLRQLDENRWKCAVWAISGSLLRV